MILLDTHAVVWLAEAPELLSRRAHEAIRLQRQVDGLAIADKTLWEIALLIHKSRITVRTTMHDFLHEVERYFTVLPVTSAIAERAILFSDRFPRNPADRLIGATAVVHGMELLTRDVAIRASMEVDCVW